MSILITFFAFIVAIIVLVTVHEAGHFYIAKWCGVKVLRFSVGFGQRLWSRRGKDGVEYVLAMIPLGGYVKMLDEREGDVLPSEQHLAFGAKPLWMRAAIVAAGPIANFLLAVLVFAAAYMVGVRGVSPVVDTPPYDTVASTTALQAEDQIIAVNGDAIYDWSSLQLKLLAAAMDDTSITLTVRRADADSLPITIPALPKDLLQQKGRFLHHVGLIPWFPEVPPVIGAIVNDSVAAQAGLKSGDTVLQVDETDIHTWQELVTAIQARPRQETTLQLQRAAQTLFLTLTPDEVVSDNGKLIGRIGAGPDNSLSQAYFDALVTVDQRGFTAALWGGVVRTGEVIHLTLGLLRKLIVNEASTANISGFITIAQVAGQSASQGLAYYLGFLGLISVSLGILNLLPIPVLDGGHLLFYAIEAVTGRPVGVKWQALGQYIGLFMIAALTVLALYNDLVRLVS